MHGMQHITQRKVDLASHRIQYQSLLLCLHDSAHQQCDTKT